MLTFRSHVECLDQELRFLGEIEYSIWQQASAVPGGYRVLLGRFCEEFSGQSLRREC